MKNLLLGMTIICFALCASSRRVPAQTPTSTARVATGQPTSGPDDNARHFEGVIVSKNGQLFVLRDDANNTWYHLDDQQAAGKHLGKKVVVIGTLDARTDVIRVQKIDETT
ncbi:MAG TPA: DUF5818 domain-containing protein [Candidatus Binatus sp.]|jgi:hypothetical protein|nr:DUF5818 domain-containing protein [Candidatus Binatus sp.]